jgi:hypothetical protein
LGNSESTDLITTAGTIQTSDDAFTTAWVARFGATPSSPFALKVASYLGGDRVDGLREISVHRPSGNIALVGDSNSDNLNATVSGPGARTPLIVGSSAVNLGAVNNRVCWVLVLNARLNRVLMGTTFGGNGSEFGQAVAFERGHDTVTIAGETASTDISYTVGGRAGTITAFVARYKIATGALVASLGFGSSGGDSVETLAVDPVTNVLYVGGRIAGSLNSPGIGTTISVQYGQSSVFSGTTDAYVAMINDRLNRMRFTFLGGTGNERIWDLAITPNGGLVAVGESSSRALPVANAGGTNVDSSGADGTFMQALLVRYSSALRLQGLTTFGAANTHDRGYGVALRQPFNNAIMVGETGGNTLQVTPGVAQPTSGFGTDGFVYDFRFYTDAVRIELSGQTVTPTAQIKARGFLNAQVVNPAGQLMTFRLSHPTARFSNGLQEISVTIPQGQISAAVDIFGTGIGVPQLTDVTATSAGSTVSTSFMSNP